MFCVPSEVIVSSVVTVRAEARGAVRTTADRNTGDQRAMRSFVSPNRRG